MPPKKESNQNNNTTTNNNNNNNSNSASNSITNTNNNVSNNNNMATTSTNATTTATGAAAAATATTTAATTTTNAASSSATVTTLPTAPAAAATLAVITPSMIDLAAEQRSIAYQANAKLCRLVRKCPWMYDRNHHNYAKKHILDKSWTKIAKDCNDSVASCKERWRNIRAAFARSINIYKTHSGPNRVKPYYLHKELSFLVKPMMEGRDKFREDCEDPKEEEEEPDEEEDNENENEPEAEQEHDHERDSRADDDEYREGDAVVASSALAAVAAITANPTPEAIAASGTVDKHESNTNDYEANGEQSALEQQTEFTSDAEVDFNFPDDTLPHHSERRGDMEAVNQMALAAQHHYLRPRRSCQLEGGGEQHEAKRRKIGSGLVASASYESFTVNEADARFLEALLPDMSLMNTRQKIIFKRKTYQTLEEVFENSSDFPKTSSTEQHHCHNNNNTGISNNNNNNNNNNMNNNISSSNHQQQQQQHHLNSAGHLAAATIAGNGANHNVRQTVLTVTSSLARTLISSIASLNESDLHKVNHFVQNQLHSRSQSPSTTNRLQNGGGGGGNSGRLAHSTPKITITKVPSVPPLKSVSKQQQAPIAHSTTAPTTSPWHQLVPITVKDEIEDVDID